MSFWLIVFLFTSDGELLTKDVYETADEQQCVALAERVTKTIINTNIQAQFHCVSDDHYMGRTVDKNVPLD